MPATITADGILDLVSSTLKAFKKDDWTSIAERLQDYVAWSYILDNDKRVEKLKSGVAIEENIKIDHTEARNVGLHDVDVISTTDTLRKVVAPWRHITHNTYVEKREVMMNMETSRIISFLKSKKMDLKLGMVQKCEENMWGKPSDPTDLLSHWGIQYWIVFNAVTGFTGGLPAGGFTDVGGIIPATNPRWFNYSAAYSVITRDDLVGKMRTGARLTRFKAPVKMGQNTGSSRAYFANNATLIGFENYAEQQNENLGKDINSMGGDVTFNRTPIHYAPFLDATSQNPVYQIDFEYFKWKVLDADYMREGEPQQHPLQHNDIVTHMDFTGNLITNNRRAQAVFATGAF